MRPGICGIIGSRGNVFSVSYSAEWRSKFTNPPLSAIYPSRAKPNPKANQRDRENFESQPAEQ
jgi:hypothetical protein